jgi:hypothetical protein
MAASPTATFTASREHVGHAECACYPVRSCHHHQPTLCWPNGLATSSGASASPLTAHATRRSGRPLRLVVAQCEARWFLADLKARHAWRTRPATSWPTASPTATTSSMARGLALATAAFSAAEQCPQPPTASLQLAMDGDEDAMLRVSHMLLAGYGTRRDLPAAADWMRQAWCVQSLTQTLHAHTCPPPFACA